MTIIKVDLEGRSYVVDLKDNTAEEVKVAVPGTERRPTPWLKTLWSRVWGVGPRGKAKEAVKVAQREKLQGRGADRWGGAPIFRARIAEEKDE